MNQHLQSILNFIQKNESLSNEQKTAILKSLKDADKELEITAFKLDRTEKVKRTTAILLEETIEELEQKRKAVEAQNRDLEMESALERVRSRSMGMQKSEELKEVIKIVYQQLAHLKINLDHAGFVVDYTSLGNWHFWIADERHIPSKITHPYFDSVWAKQFNEAKEKGIDFFTTHLNFEEKNKFYQDLLKHIPGLTEQTKDFYFSCAGLGASTVLLGDIGLYIENFSGHPYSDEENNILMRFAKVFQQTYTRFLDLQKAEAQAREAKIESALEKVRSRTMAMQHSSELGKASALLFQQIKSLGVLPWSCGFNIWEQGDTVFTSYMGSPDGANLDGYKIPLTEEVTFIHFRESRDRGDKLFIDVLEGERLEAHYQYFLSLPEIKKAFEKRAQAGQHRPTFQINHLANFSHGNLMFITYEPCPEMHDVFKRFAKVFEQTYTRFLDLQKAEAQAREAEIELSLERIRSKAMAMHGSGDILATTTTAFEELQKLGIHSIRCGIGLLSKNSMDAQVYAAATDSNGIFQTLVGVRDMNDHPSLTRQYQSWLKKKNIVEVLQDEELTSYYNKLFFQSSPTTTIPQSFDKKQYGYYFSFADGLFYSWSDQPYSDNEKNILNRFNAIVALTFRRFLDLQKAEAQAREAQIQLALERVRARTMAMQRSEELEQCAVLLFQQINELGINAWSAGFSIWQENDTYFIGYNTNPTGGIGAPFRIPLTEDVFFKTIREAKRSGEEFLVFESEGKSLVETYRYMDTLPVVGEVMRGIVSAGYELPKYQVTHCGFFPEGHLMFITLEPQPEAWDIFKRFTKVFEQTYTRFIDLQKAEEQVREAKIEAALEKVRSKTMAMQKGEELKEVAVLLYKELIALGVNNFVTCGYVEINEKINRQFTWVTSPGGDTFGLFYLPLTGDTTFDERYAAWKQQQIIFHQTVAGEVRSKHLEYAITTFNSKEAEEMVLSQFPDPTVFYCFNFSHGYLHLVSGSELKNEEELLLVRFTRVFEQTYARFLDLQKAEAQAREAKIEAALERVRSRSMAMQKSEELTEVAGLLFKQVTDLGIKSWTAGFNVWSDDNNSYVDYITSPNGGFIEPYTVLTNRAEALQDISNARKSGVEFDVQYVEGEKIKQLYIALTGLGEEQFEKMRQDGNQFPSHQYEHFVFGSRVSLMFITYEPAPEAHDIFKRFGKVFEQTYTRFLDLQKAEAQTREAQIQLAMERVRARTMAMQKSDELLDVASILFQQVKALGVPQWNCGFDIWDIGDKEFTYYPGSPDGIISPSPCNIPLTEHAVFRRFDESRRRGDDLLIYEKEGEEQADHYHYMLSLPGVGELLRSMLDAGFQLPTFQIDHVANFLYGNLIFITYEHFPEMHDVFKRFAKVFEQTYTRFLDLQKAEAQALETVKRASVDRVRAEIASMRTTNDLQRITPLIWRELTTISVPFIRCGVFIMDEEQQQVHTFLSTPDGKANASFHQPFSTPGEIAAIIKNWRAKQMYRQHWDEAQFIEFTKNLVEQGAVTSGEKYLTENRPTNLDLHFLPFLQGMLYVGNTTPLSDDELQLVQNLADAFSTAYARYDDFNKLESAKVQIEKTLVDLKQAQAQLVQSAKMASLGELTAGIAHEIQNPLNFVNNFSEVNKELIAEMKEEMDKGNLDDAKLIADDIAENEQKINHHGKRADAIVKGMLQHSRSSTATKELTNINALADEYLRLAYHGLRAKEKSFNATLKTDFDESIQKIDIIPQDIGRVILNLITNAFYTVAEKKKSPHPLKGGEVYEPVVTITTRRLGSPSGDVGKVEISVKDNGNGIPEKIVDKIFQPFFTTKPTGQGTGLGLSLAYDIVKTHGGDLTVESKEGEGSEFIIQLPIV